MTRNNHPLRGLQRLIAAGLLLITVGCSDDGASAGEKGPGDSAMMAVDAFIREKAIDTTSAGWKTKLPKPPLVPFDASKTYYWKLVTNQGEIRFKMRTDIAPMHVSSTFYLTRLGFFDGLKFHRVIQGFMAQGGDPLGSGRGGPGYKYAGEYDDSARHDGPGVLSMANAGPRTDGSQFFITFKATPSLNDKHTVFGNAMPGDSMTTIREIESLGAKREPGRTREPVVIERATILIE